MMPNVAVVAVPRPIDRTFDYSVPASMAPLSIGVRVRVKFGRETVVGYVVASKGSSEFKGKLQAILEVLDEHSILDQAAWDLAHWMREHYMCPLGLVLQAILPQRLGPAKPSQRKLVSLNVSLAQALSLIETLKEQAPQQARLLQALLNLNLPPLSELLKQTKVSHGPLRALVERKVVSLIPMPVSAFDTSFDEPDKDVALSEKQRDALNHISNALHGSSGQGFLLQGVNGSGKTEVYVRAVQAALRLGQSALVLTPEISLTPQLIKRFRHRLGDQLAVLHSGLTQAQQKREWLRLRQGEAKVLLGVRSASLLPIEDLGLVIVDEEHEPTFQQDAPEPRYHAVDVLRFRCQNEKLVLVMGSATPSLNAHHASEAGQLKRLMLPDRIVSAPKPVVDVVDVSQQRGWMSPLLKASISDALARGCQIMLMLNRKGFGVGYCKICKQTQRCPQCEICMVYQVQSSQLRCHYCGHTRRQTLCSTCGGALKMVGAGTQRIEQSLHKHFSAARVARMDADSVGRGQHAKLLETFRQGQIDILLGTQMLAVGHDYPNVSLMGILDADTLLHLPDYRASERTFQLLSQAIGRAGRGGERAKVVVQTRHSDHYAIQYAFNGEYEKFVQQESALRKTLGYPPFARLISLQSSQPNEHKAQAQLEELRKKILSLDPLDVLGPTKALPFRWRGQYRWRLLVKTDPEHVIQGEIWQFIKNAGLDGQIKVEVEG